MTFVLWLFGIRYLYERLFLGDGFNQLFEILRNGGIAILVIFALKTAWIYYNYQFIFKKKGERRRQARSCRDEEVIKFFNVSIEDLEKARKQNRIKVILKDKEVLITIPINRS